MSRSRVLLVVLAVVSGTSIDCIGDPGETASGALNAEIPLQANASLGGIYVNDSPTNGPIRELTIGSCWMSIDFFDGTWMAGPYYAHGQGIVDSGILQHLPNAGSARRTGAIDETYLWTFQRSVTTVFDGEPLIDLSLRSVNAPGAFGQRTVLRKSSTQLSGLSVDADDRPEDWCLQGPNRWQKSATPGLVQLPDGRYVVAPSDHQQDNRMLMGIWSGTGSVKELRIGPCYMEADLLSGDWMKGNYVALTSWHAGQRRGILELDLAEYGQADVAPDGTYQTPGDGPALVTHPTWAEVLGIGFVPVTNTLDVIRYDGEPERLRRVAEYPEGDGERWCWWR